MELTHGDSEIEVFTESQEFFEGHEHIETEDHETCITDQDHSESQDLDKSEDSETEAPLVGESDGTQRCARSQREHLQEQRSEENRGIAQEVGGT